MAKLITQDGQAYMQRDGKWIPLSPSEYAKQQIYQQHVQGQSAREQGMTAAGKYFSDFGSGASQLLGGPQNAQDEQQFRADQQQRYQSQEDYGGAAETVGGFTAPAATALLPGGLAAQSVIGGGQGMIENPDNPYMGAAIGVASTLVGDWAGNALSRMGKAFFTKRMELSPDPFYSQAVQAGEDAGLQFTPGQRAGNASRQIMERELQKNPRYAGLDMDRFLSNQARLNDLAAETLGLTPTGRVTGPMRGQAAKSVGDAFDAIADQSSPIQLLDKDFIDASRELVGTDPGNAWLQSMMNRFPEVFTDAGKPMSGEQFNRLRNWMARQSRINDNITSGVSEDIQPLMRVLDDSLEAANLETNPMLVDEIRRARTKWKSLLVVEHAQRGGEAAAQGNLSPVSAYNALRKYDKGGLFRGKSRDPFNDAIQAMAMVGDKAPTVRPSGDPSLATGPMNYLKELLWSGPAAERYMQGGNLGEMMMGIMEPSPTSQAVAKTLGIGGARGLMQDDEQGPR